MPEQTIKLTNNETAIFDSFLTIVAIAKLSFPSNPPYNNKSSYPLIPAFIFYKTYSGERRCIRLGGCLPVISVDEMFFPFLLQPVLDIYDFSISLLSGRCVWESEYYLYYHCVVTFKQAKSNWSLPVGVDAVDMDGHFYIQLFHHTTSENSEMICKERFLKPSVYNYCGNRKLKASFCYLTNIPRAKKIFDTLPLLKDDGSGVISCFVSDDGILMRIVDLVVDDRILDAVLPFLISTDLIQPSPAVCHIETQNHKEWLELMFINIYRCPCSGFKLEESMIYKGKQHWIIRPENTEEFRTNDPILIAHGEDMMSLQSLVNETFSP